MFARIEPTAAERSAPRAGDDLVPVADVVMDRAFTVAAPAEQLWPWLLQLGKRRAGWYLPRWIERLLPPGRRAARTVRQEWQRLQVGDVVPDYGGRHATFEVAVLRAPHVLVYRSRRGRTGLSWALTLTSEPGGTRLHLRLRLGPVRRQRLARVAGGFLDALTVVGLAAGLRERLAAQR
jgi:hypothetical protein